MARRRSGPQLVVSTLRATPFDCRASLLTTFFLTAVGAFLEDQWETIANVQLGAWACEFDRTASS